MTDSAHPTTTPDMRDECRTFSNGHLQHLVLMGLFAENHKAIAAIALEELVRRADLGVTLQAADDITHYRP